MSEVAEEAAEKYFPTGHVVAMLEQTRSADTVAAVERYLPATQTDSVEVHWVTTVPLDVESEVDDW